jgi:hypothetical protein
MKKTSILSIFLVSTLVLSGCGKNSSESSQNSSSVSPPVVAETKVEPIVAKVDPIVFESDGELGIALGMMGQGDALLKKKLGTNIGNPITIKKMFVWSTDSSDWEKGGKLHLINDDSMGRAYRITCSISSQDGDKFMETNKRRTIVASGILMLLL